MLKNTEKYITGRIKVEKVIPGGQALATLADGKKIMLWGALPGETVTEWQLTKSKSTYAEGIARQITDPSPSRIAPRDDCYLSTSPWQIYDYDYELVTKRELLREIFRQQKIDLADVEIAPVQTDGREFQYRNKMEYSLYYDHDDHEIHLAFRARGSHRKVPITRSSLELPAIWQRATEIVAELNRTGTDSRRYQSLLLRSDQSGRVAGGLLENHRPHPQFDLLTDQILDQTYSYSPNGFFQINLPVYEAALSEIRTAIQTQDVLDLYAGVGTIGLSVARDRSLTLVECDKSAYREMERNCSGTTARPVLAKSEDALEYVRPGQTVIVDPPRAGCLPSVIDRFRDVRPRTIVYLSCNPITQARDLARLVDLYRIVTCRPYNFFPRTPHLENLVVLEAR